ncbi:TRAFAC clade GTPase domain-containing protein [Actinokineospora sp. HUAS TT18]|uniref:TRAFAC clade GTPase domain-containing protein n=1 Tax=Actinokineospora sp. HUAS TT18 TaxID=3447451 RepID=UPI003F523F10
MTGMSAPVLCPICLDNIEWPNTLYQRELRDGKLVWDELDLTGHTNPTKQEYLRTLAFVRCPNPSGDSAEPHYLPAIHNDYGKPIIIGVVGRSTSGKTHLLVAMLAELLRGRLSSHGLHFEIADRVQHQTFDDEIRKLRDGVQLQSTNDLIQSFASYLIVRPKGRPPKPLIFFDVSGEDFNDSNVTSTKQAGFLLAADALLFVDDPVFGLPGWRTHSKTAEQRSAAQAENKAFDGAISRLLRQTNMAELPIAVAITKADMLRYEFPVDHWLRRDDVSGPLDPRTFREESRDVFAVLQRYQAETMLNVYRQFSRRTMHVVSATGGASDGQRNFPRGVRPIRVLQPLLALLAMTGFLDTRAAAEVGR